MKKVIFLSIISVAFSCSSKEKENETVKEDIIIDTIQEVSDVVEVIESETQLIVTPEHWENFVTDISVYLESGLSVLFPSYRIRIRPNRCRQKSETGGRKLIKWSLVNSLIYRFQ